VGARLREAHHQPLLDHGVTLPSGESFFNPMTEAEFEQDAKVLLGDLEKLKAVIEAPC